MTHQLKVEKMIARPAADIFEALKQGRLFMNCSADSGSMKIDFRKGGAYEVEFKNVGKKNFGEFLEIIPNKKVVFTWCQSFTSTSKPDTQVTIELFEDGPKTRVSILHTGFKDEGMRDDHTKGWSAGLADLGNEIQNGSLRIVRSFNVPINKLYETCKNPASFFAFMGDITRGTIDFRVGGRYQVPTEKGEVRGEFTEIVPGQKIVMTWLSGCEAPLENSKVTLLFHERGEGKSALEIVQDGLPTTKDQMAHRRGWEVVTTKMSETFA